MSKTSTSKKFRLPRNWADQLTIEEARGILSHWESRVAFWDALTGNEPGAARHARICRTRVKLWQECLERKHAKLPCQDLVSAAVAHGDEPMDLDLSVPYSTPVSPTKAGAKPKRNSSPSLFD